MTHQHLHRAAKFSATAKAIPDHPCLIQGRQRLSWQQPDERSDRVADAWLAARRSHFSMEHNSPPSDLSVVNYRKPRHRFVVKNVRARTTAR